MKLSNKNKLLLSFTLFSLFFGAGNLIFPPLLGQQAGTNAIWAFIGFLITSVLLPVLGVIIVSKFGGLTILGNKVGPKFSLIFTLLIYLSIGPGLGIPRAGSVPFEMAVYPYLPEGASFKLWMAVYTLIFFAIVLWLCFNPGKLVKRIGTFLTPSLLTLIFVMFIVFLFKGKKVINDPIDAYSSASFLKGFVDGYQTMDTIAALNFGLVVVVTLNGFGVSDKKSISKNTIFAGVVAGIILTSVYSMLTIIGTYTSGVYTYELNDKTVEYYYEVIEEIEDAVDMGEERRGIRPVKHFPTLIQSSSYANEVKGLALNKQAIRDFLGYEKEFWDYISSMDNTDVIVSYEVAKNIAYANPLYNGETSLVTGVKMYIPEIADLSSALLAIQTYEKAYSIWKCLGKEYVPIEFAFERQEEFEKTYLPKLDENMLLQKKKIS